MSNKLIFAFVLLVNGCATTPPQSIVPEPETKVAVPTYKVVGFTVDRFSGSRSCPLVRKTADLQDNMKWASACVRADNWLQVEAFGNEMAIQFPNEAWGAYFLSLSAEHSKDLPRARWMAEAAVKKSPNEGVTLYQLGRLQWEMSERFVALETLKKAVEKNPSLVDAHVLMGQLAMMDGQMSAAEKSFLKAYDHDAENLKALLGLAEIGRQNKHWAEAEKYLQTAVAAHPKSNEARSQLAEVQSILTVEQAKQQVSDRQPTAEGKKVSK